MVVHYTLTLADYKEARAAMGFGARWLTHGAVAWIGLAVLVIALAAQIPTRPATLRLVALMLPLATFWAAFMAIAAMQRWQLRHRRDIRPRTQVALLVFAAVSLIAGAVLISRADAKALWAEASIFGVVWWALPLFFILVIGVRMIASSGSAVDVWKMLVDQHRPKELELLPDGIAIRDGVSNYQVSWQGIASGMESENLFVLLINRYSFLMVPKRAFANDEDRSRFREAMKSIHPPTGGFPVDLPEAKLQE